MFRRVLSPRGLCAAGVFAVLLLVPVSVDSSEGLVTSEACGAGDGACCVESGSFCYGKEIIPGFRFCR